MSGARTTEQRQIMDVAISVVVARESRFSSVHSRVPHNRASGLPLPQQALQYNSMEKVNTRDKLVLTWLTPSTACAGQLRTHCSRGIVGYSLSERVTCVLTDCHCMASSSKSQRSTLPLFAALSGSTALSSTTVCKGQNKTNAVVHDMAAG